MGPGNEAIPLMDKLYSLAGIVVTLHYNHRWLVIEAPDMTTKMLSSNWSKLCIKHNSGYLSPYQKYTALHVCSLHGLFLVIFCRFTDHRDESKI